MLLFFDPYFVKIISAKPNNSMQLDDLQQRNFFEIVLKQIPGVFWTVNKDLVFTSSFGSGLKFLKLKPGEVVGKSLFEYFNTQDTNFLPIASHIKALQGELVEHKFSWQNRNFKIFLTPLIDNSKEIIGVVGFAIDTTDEDLIYEELKSSEEKYKALFESADDAIFLMNNEFFIDCNTSTFKMFNCTKSDIIGEPPYKFSPPTQPDGRPSKEKALELINRAYNGEILSFEWVHTTLDGTPFYAEVKLNRMKIKDSYYLLAIVRNITNRKEKDKQIQFLANSLESISESVSITDLNDTIIYVNKKFCETYGYSKEELLGKSILIVRSEKNDPENVKNIFEDKLKGGWTGELWNKRKNGEEFLIRLSTSPIFGEDKKLIAMIRVATDITKEKEILNKIKYDAERLKILFEEAPDPIFVADHDGKILEANAASGKLVGYTKEEALGKTFFELNLFDRKNFQKVPKIFYKALKMSPTGPDEIVIRNKKGELIYIEVSTHPIEIEGKKLILCTARNITERKKILLELAKAKEEAERANKQKTIFFASLSHEIKTPMNVILGFSDVLKDIFYDKSDNEVKNYFDILQNAAKTLLQTISQILDFSRIETSSFKYEIKKVSITKEINDVVELLEVLAEKKKLNIELSLPDEEIFVMADQYTLNGIILNILSNAIKYSDKGTIRIKLSKDENYAICEISDEGLGMSEEFQSKMFTDFTRDKYTEIRKREGTGLGLALTKKYIDINKGMIDIKSKLNYGTTVTFKIPLAKN